mmetsp:Transcript_49377/g.77156  ORF Transcript_49377/g.77156 Transcript_49377/m.77156 type:complete len:98 (-) Transcript_49377:565-858(-)
MHLSSPPRIIPILVLSASASAIEWVVRSSTRPRRSERINSHIFFLLIGSIPVLGSSRRTIDGDPMRDMATASFLLLPPEKVWTVLSAHSSRTRSLSS